MNYPIVQSIRPIFKIRGMFDNYIINLNWFGSMVKKISSVGCPASESASCDEKESIFEECE